MKTCSTSFSKYSISFILILAVLHFSPSLIASPPPLPTKITAATIVSYIDDLLRGKTSQGEYEMQVYTPRWNRTINMVYWSKGRNLMLIKIAAPAKDRGTSFLKVDYQFWDYVPTIERVIKLPPSMMLQSWMGSDFTNDDL